MRCVRDARQRGPPVCLRAPDAAWTVREARPPLLPASQIRDNHGCIARAARPDRGARGPTQDAWGARRRGAVAPGRSGSGR